MKKITIKMIAETAKAYIDNDWNFCDRTALGDNFSDSLHAAREIAKRTGDDANRIQDAIHIKTYEMWKSKQHKKVGRPFAFDPKQSEILPPLRVEQPLSDAMHAESKKTSITISELRRMAYREKFGIDRLIMRRKK